MTKVFEYLEDKQDNNTRDALITELRKVFLYKDL